MKKLFKNLLVMVILMVIVSIVVRVIILNLPMDSVVTFDEYGVKYVSYLKTEANIVLWSAIGSALTGALYLIGGVVVKVKKIFGF